MPTLLSTNSSNQLFALSPKKKLVFLLLMIERMIPQLREFCEDAQRDPSAFEEARSKLWDSLSTKANGTDWMQLKNRVLDATPDSEEFGSQQAGLALSAALIVAEAAAFAGEDKDSHIADALRYARESVDAEAMNEMGVLAYDAGVESTVSQHQVVQREKRAEEDDIAFLSAVRDEPWSPSVISELTRRGASQLPAVQPNAGRK